MFLRPRRVRRSVHSRPERTATAATVELLEDRCLLTTTLFFDFGAGLGIGGNARTTVANFETIFGPGLNGNGTGSGLEGLGGLMPNDSLEFRPLQYDFDGNGALEDADITALADAVVPFIERALEPFDIDVVVGAAANFGAAADAVAANAGDVTGEFDAYNFVGDFRSGRFNNGSVGNNTGLFGIAAADDLFAQRGNRQDEASLSFSDLIFGSTAGQRGTAAFNNNLAARIAYTASHEAFHTLSGIHSVGLEAGGDIIRLGSVTREDPFQVVRFDLDRQSPGVRELNNYLLLRDDPDIGLRDDDRDGTPDLAYISGTGAHDAVTLTRASGNTIGVSVSAYDDPARSALIGTEGYIVNLVTDTAGDVLVDGGVNRDLITLDGRIRADFRVRGGTGLDGAPTERDELVVDGGGRSAAFVAAAGGGLLTVTDGATVEISETEVLTFRNFAPVAAIDSVSTPREEGTPIDVTASASDIGGDTNLVYTYRVFRNGSTTPEAGGSGTNLTDFRFTPRDGGSYAIELTVRNSTGLSTTVRQTIQVDQVDPDVASVNAPTVRENGVATLDGTISDPGTSAAYTVTVDWGDGTVTDAAVNSAERTFTASHRYLDDDPTGTPADRYTVRLTVRDDGGGSNTRGTTVRVLNDAPRDVTFGVTSASQTRLPGQVVDFAGLFEDAGTADTHTAVVDWGDGTAEALDLTQFSGGGRITGSHAFTRSGRFVVTATVTDDDGGVGRARVVVDVAAAGVLPDDLRGGNSLFVFGTDRADRIHVYRAAGGFGVTLNRTRLGVFGGADRVVVEAGGGADHVSVSATPNGGVEVPAILFGEAGRDLLVGGNGDDLLVGGTGDDRLIGRGGNNVLVGGLGTDLILGGAGQNLLVAGVLDLTARGLPDEERALDLVAGVWSSGDPFDRRVARLNPVLVVQETVFDDDSRDVLRGGANLDWYFAEIASNDSVFDSGGDSVFNNDPTRVPRGA